MSNLFHPEHGELLSVQAAAVRLGVSERTVHRYREAGRLVPIRVHGLQNDFYVARQVEALAI